MKSTGSVRRQILQHTLSFFSAILAALILGLLLLWLDGKTPRDVLNSAFTSTFASNFRFANMVSRLLTIVLVALASAIPFKAGIWNIGAAGPRGLGGVLGGVFCFLLKPF